MEEFSLFPHLCQHVLTTELESQGHFDFHFPDGTLNVPFKWFLAYRDSSCENSLFTSASTFIWVILVLVSYFLCPLYILDFSPLLVVGSVTLSSQFVGCTFVQFTLSFALLNNLKLMGLQF